MTAKHYFRVWLVAILFMSFAFVTAIKLSSQSVGPAPTLKDCKCIVVHSFKQTEDAIKFGEATVYSDFVVFKFGNTIKSFTQYGIYWIDEKQNTWMRLTTENGDVIFKDKKTLFIYNTNNKIE